MAAPGYRVSAESLAGVSRDLSGGAGEIMSQLDGLKAKVEGLADDWEGSGKAAFTELYRQLDDSGRKVQEALLGISTMLSNVSGHYDEAETTATNTFRI
ncbi:WXG100 family type VII secretion target [Cellulosimicrobium arenosum]|uniref:ESAT-6-like protein n=1 Tax=Cellulosimicrobium arenosum TaxID=2708133 RepID=A0A927G8X9_9MICO|nr:WXG100 family type VII secretion target [Cellulosimicrobium arenosum]MBD8078739.1 WXG100 family type VII secretion target [Cellulosimicrobium arenosum]